MNGTEHIEERLTGNRSGVGESHLGPVKPLALIRS